MIETVDILRGSEREEPSLSTRQWPSSSVRNYSHWETTFIILPVQRSSSSINTDWSWGRATTQKVWDSERTLLHRSQRWNLLSTIICFNRTAAFRTITTWKQKLHKLDVAQATMELQVQSCDNCRQIVSLEIKMQVLRSTYRCLKACVIREKYYG